MKFKGEEQSRMIGGFWLVAENKGEMMGMPYHRNHDAGL